MELLGKCEQHLKNRSARRKRVAIKNRLIELFKTNEWRIKDTELAISSSLASLGEHVIHDDSPDTRFVFGDLSKTTKDELTKAFHKEFAAAAKKQFGTWVNAAEALKVDQKTLQKYMRGHCVPG
jgi:hypothetical protein